MKVDELKRPNCLNLTCLHTTNCKSFYFQWKPKGSIKKKKLLCIILFQTKSPDWNTDISDIRL